MSALHREVLPPRDVEPNPTPIDLRRERADQDYSATTAALLVTFVFVALVVGAIALHQAWLRDAAHGVHWTL